MVTFTSALGRYAILLSVVCSGKGNYVIAAGSSTLMEEPSASTAAWTDVHRQLATCCLLTGTSECHPNDACNARQKDCENAGGRNKCNRNGNYSWRDSSPVPPPTPNPTPPPVNPTPPPTNPPVNPTPPPTNPPVSASCGLCVEDTSISCNANSECPQVPSPGTCSAPSPQPTNGEPCTTNDECEPNQGKPQNRGTCVSGGMVFSECDPNLCPPTNAPTPLPTNAPTNVPTNPPTNAPTSPPTTSNPTSPPSPNPTPVPSNPPTPAPSNPPTNVPTSNPTPVPSNPPTPVPTNPPTNVPTADPTPAPSNLPTPAPSSPPTNVQTAEPTPNPTPVPSNPPTNVPTAEPTPNPTPAPSNPPTNVQTAEPTPNPTPVPSSPPTDAQTPEPTAPPTNVPTSNPTALPTSNPTSLPTNNPTNAVETTVYCPTEAGTSVTLTAGTKSFARSTAASFCGIFIELESGDLIPYARSYSNHDWEPAPGPMAAPYSGIECSEQACTVELPDPSSGSYVIMMKPTNALDNKAKIARFLEMTSFGPTVDELASLDVGTFGENERADAVRAQMLKLKSSHREYFRTHANPKWDATTQNAKTDHPCDPNSHWRTYAYTRLDRRNTITGGEIYTTFEEAPEDENATFTIYEAESQDVTLNTGIISTSNTGFSGEGYIDMGGYDDFAEFNISVPEDVTVPISFRYAQGSSSYNGNRPCVLSVNGVTVRDVYNFSFSDAWTYWIYSSVVTVSLTAGFNTIKLTVRDQNGGPNIDFMQVGSRPAVLMKTNGWLRHVAKNHGVGILNQWGVDFTNQTVYFPSYANSIEGDLYRYPYGRLRVNYTGTTRDLDIGNPKLDFDGYESHLPLSHFMLNNGEVFVSTSTDLSDYPQVRDQEFILPGGLDRSLYPVCDTITNNEEYSSPVYAKTPTGEWLQWTPMLKLESNGPPMNASPDQKTSFTLLDGGGQNFIQTGEKLKCSNVARSFENEDTCIYSTSSTACSPTRDLGEVTLEMNETTVTDFYDYGDKFVYAIRGLVMEDLDQHACRDDKSRWEVELNTTCSLPTQLENETMLALAAAFASSTDPNALLKDINGPLTCNPSDEIVDKLGMQVQVGSDCYTHVHRDHKSVFDFTGWVSNHPGGEYNIQKWAEGWNNVTGWYLDFPFAGNPERKIPKHQMSRWDNNKGEPYIVYVAKLGNSIAYRDLPSSLKTTSIAEHFGATAIQNEGAGVIVCGSHGEVANDRSQREQFDFRSNEEQVTSSATMDNQRHVVWYEVNKSAQDQLRQRMAHALSLILTVVPGNIDAETYTEVYTKYYDIFVKHAFGNYGDIMRLVSYSPLMAEHLTFVKSKSHAYVYRKEDKRDSRPDENYAREIMQLFTIGLYELNEDGTQVIDSSTGKPKQTYTNEHIESFARVWTGFDREAVRGNYEDRRGGSTDNKLDAMQVIAAYRDAFPKPDLTGGFLGDRYVRCVDLPSKSFLKKGAVYTLRGSSPLSEYRTDPSQYATVSSEKFVLGTNSSLYELLHNGGQYKLTVELADDLICEGNECNVDTVRMVKVDDVYYEFKEKPCVQMAFYDDGKQIRAKSYYDLGSMCANPNLAHASEACCRDERYQEVRVATKVTGETYLYEGERTTYNTARDRCVNAGKDLCVYEYTNVSPVNDWWRKGYSWTNKDCEILVKVNQEGYIAVVHNAENPYKNQIDRYGIPAEVDENETLNYFKVNWAGDFPGSSPENSCAANGCNPHSDGSCVCKTSVSESVVFTSIDGIDKEQVMAALFLGAIGPDASSVPTNGSGFIAHVVNGVIDESTVFEVEDKGRTFFLKNLVSEVHVNGWEALTPMILEAEDATELHNVTILDSTSLLASNGKYADFDSTDAAYVTWEVNAPSSGDYHISFRYAMDTYTRQMEVYVNGQLTNWTSPDANPLIDLDYLSGDPQKDVDFVPMTRCQGDCDTDDNCAAGLFCFQVNRGDSAFPGCNNLAGSDYCVDPNDIENMPFFPTGSWNSAWRLTEKKIVNLVEGVNTIKIKVPYGNDNAPNIDYMKIEGIPTATIASKFRNPPHFVSLIGEENAYSEQNRIDAEYETEAFLEHLVYHPNVAPFLTFRIIQRFGVSNPSPRYVKTCSQAFKTGRYESGSHVFGDDTYGSLEALAACVVLDPEATDEALLEDLAFGSLREPIIMTMNVLRSFEFSNKLPTVGLDGPPLAEHFNTRLWKMDEKTGQCPHDNPSVFSFFSPEFIPESGPATQAKLVSPEATLLDMPKIIGIQNGLISMIKYGLSDCNSGFATYPGYRGCSDNGLYERSIGHLSRVPGAGTTIAEMVSEVSLLLTGGRLSQENKNIIEAACSSEPDSSAQYRCIQQLIVFSSEFHTTNTMKKSGEARAVDTTTAANSTEPYKAIVYLYLAGGTDSYHMLAPNTCDNDVYEKFQAIRGKNSLSEGIGLKREEMLNITANNPEQPCSVFGIHPNLSILKKLYDDGDAAFIANAGLMSEPVDVTNYRQTPVQLFAHNDMSQETKRGDLFQEFAGTGVHGRMSDILNSKGMPTNIFSISGTQAINIGEPGKGSAPFILSGSGLSAFNNAPSIQNMNAVIADLNNATKKDSGVFAETYASKLSESMSSHDLLKTELDAVEDQISTPFPSGGLGDQFKMVSQLMLTRENRGVVRDMFYVSQGGYDTHSNMRVNVANRFSELDAALESFVNETKAQGLWDSVTLVQFAEFARTLDPNTGEGSDHAWGANHFHIGGGLAGGKVRGLYPSDFVQSPSNPIALSRGRMIPTHPWDAMWYGTAQWFGIDEGEEMDKVLPMHQNFPNKTYAAAELYGDLFA